LAPLLVPSVLSGISDTGFNPLGFWKKQVFERGFLMVNLWWIRGKSWCVNGRFFGSKNMSRIADLFGA
jgi:hypothetical protein